MTATASGSAYPLPIEELIPAARRYAATLDRPLSRNLLMKHFRIGSPKATAVMEALAADASAKPEQPTAPPAPRGGLTLVPPPEPPADAAPMGPPASTDPQPAELAESGRLFEPAAAAPQDGDAPTRADGPPGPRSKWSRYGMVALLTVVGVLLAGVIVAPIALSSQDIIAWADSPTGLGLTSAWAVVTFLALDAAAAVCVGLVVYCAWRGESAGAFGWLVWAFAGMSAYAHYSHSLGSPARDAVWFFPAMSIAGPFLLEIIVRRVRRWVQEGTGQRIRHSVSFGLARWLPGIGALRETYGAWRLARLDHLTDARQAVIAYRQLCPDGSIRVLRALRNRDATR